MSFINNRVRKIVETVGQEITFTKVTRVYNTATGENVETKVNYTVQGFLRQYTPQELSGGLVQQIDRELKIAKESTVNFTPTENDDIVVNAKTYTIMSVQELNAKGEDALYVLRIRGNAD